MYTQAGSKNLCDNKWLASLVDAMEEVEASRADDICRAIQIPSSLLAQLYGRHSAAARARPQHFALS